MQKDYNKLLFDKVQAEYDAFEESLKQMTPEEIIGKAYQKVFKEELVNGIDISNLTQTEAKALYLESNSLDRLYKDWMESNHSYMDILRDSIDDSAKEAVKRMKERHRESR